MGSNCQSAPFPGHTLNSSKSLVKSCGIIILPTGSGPAYFQWSQHASNADSPWKFCYMNREKIEGRNSFASEFRYRDVSISFDVNCSVDFYSHEPISSVLFCGCTICCCSVNKWSDSLHPQGLEHVRPPCPSPSPRSLPKFVSIELMMPSNRLILCCFLLLLSIFPSTRVFFLEKTMRHVGILIPWPEIDPCPLHWKA